jgi:hypothetical protein
MRNRIAAVSRAGSAKVVLLAGVLLAGFSAGYATAQQPHMQNALNFLQSARAELNMAERNKGGHLPIALTRIDEAIYQVQLGIQAGGGG